MKKNVHNPRLVLMFGVPGSGKNWVLKKRRKKNHVIINVDDCLAMLPDYWRAMERIRHYLQPFISHYLYKPGGPRMNKIG